MLERMWNPDHIVELAVAGLQRRSEELDAEQAVRGLDALTEVELHPVLAAGFAQGGLGVFREWPYPGGASRRPRHAERERCDLVLTTAPGVRLIDPVARLREVDESEGTLFASQAADLVAAEPGVDPADAFWLEVKQVGQFTYTRGVPGPNAAYSSELLRVCASDIPKLAQCDAIAAGGVLLVVFHESDEVAAHDLHAFVSRCLDRDLPIREPVTRGLDVSDRIGNRRCSLMLVPVRTARGA